jgi:hypothetical protein
MEPSLVYLCPQEVPPQAQQLLTVVFQRQALLSSLEPQRIGLPQLLVLRLLPQQLEDELEAERNPPADLLLLLPDTDLEVEQKVARVEGRVYVVGVEVFGGELEGLGEEGLGEGLLEGRVLLVERFLLHLFRSSIYGNYNCLAKNRQKRQRETFEPSVTKQSNPRVLFSESNRPTLFWMARSQMVIEVGRPCCLSFADFQEVGFRLVLRKGLADGLFW